MYDFKVGDEVMTRKGCRIQGPSGGRILGFCMFNGYKAARIIKYNGQKRVFLIHNLYKVHYYKKGGKVNV